MLPAHASCCLLLQVWLVLELCTGGTLKDAVTMGKLVTGSKLELVSKVVCFTNPLWD